MWSEHLLSTRAALQVQGGGGQAVVPETAEIEPHVKAEGMAVLYPPAPMGQDWEIVGTGIGLGGRTAWSVSEDDEAGTDLRLREQPWPGLGTA